MIRRSNHRVVGWLAVAGLLFFCTTARGQEVTPLAKRAAVPAVAAQNETRKLLGDLFRADYEQAKKPEEKTALAEKMLQVGSDTLDDPTGQYMLFQIAKEIAIGAPSADVALKAVDAQGATFEIDVPDAKLATVTAIEKTLKISKDRQALQETLDQLVEEFLQAERYDLAKQGVTLSIDLAKKIPDPNAIKQATARLKEIDSREKLFGEVQAARKVLETKPDDPAANLAVGRALCLVNGDWEQGLPHLAKCGDAKLKAIAEQELAQPQTADKQMELADAWWDLSEKETGPLQSTMQQRAVAWYQTALPQLTGLAKLKVTGRIEKVGAKPGEGTSVAAGSPNKPMAKPTKPVITNSIGMKLVLIPAGKFIMGGDRAAEMQHLVTLTKPFYMGATEVTQGQWTALMGTKPWEGDSKAGEGANYAASFITWNEAVEFCRKLSEKEGKTYRLPTEAEWEYTCRAGTTGPYHNPPDTQLRDYALIGTGAVGEVAKKLPNAAGLFDMQGNVREYCSDWFAEFTADPATDPQGPDTGPSRMVRGASWGSDLGAARSSQRFAWGNAARNPYTGLRVVYDPMAAPPTKPTTISSPITGAQKNQVISNSIGMKLVLIQAGTFTIGSPQDERGHKGEEVQHLVTLTKPFYLGTTEVTQEQWTKVMGTEPWQGKNNARESATNAASFVSWDDANEFCRRLSEKEKKKYRLPTEAEWEYACRAGTTGQWNFEVEANANDHSWNYYNVRNIGETFAHPVAQKPPNAWGLYDTHGNVWEWCQDWSGPYAEGNAIDPQGPTSGQNRRARGGSGQSSPIDCRSAFRFAGRPDTREWHYGFRVVYDPQLSATTNVAKPTTPVSKPTTVTPSPVGGMKSPPLKAPPASLPRMAANSIGIPLVLIPGGKFTMGSPEGEEGRKPDETQHQVTITKYFYIGATEVTQGQWKGVMGTEPWEGKTDAKSDDLNAASYITWDDAKEFCRKLGEKEKKTYRLPTEAEWEYACRAGTTTAWSYGEPTDYEEHKNQMWNYFNCVRFGKNHEYAHAVGKKPPNPAGLFDMHGNVKEWCQDWSAPYPDGDAVDPQGAESGTIRVARGGSGTNQPPGCRSATRDGYKPTAANWVTGFRVVYDPQTPFAKPATTSAPAGTSSSSTPAASPIEKTAQTPVSRTGPDGPDKWKDFQNDQGEVVGNVIRLNGKGSLSTTAQASGPMEITIVARTNSTNIRVLAIGKSQVIWNWEVRNNELRVHWPNNSISTAKVTPLETGRWYRLHWVIEKDKFSVYTDDELVFQETKPGMTFTPNPVKVIPSHGSVVEVESFVVEPLKQ